VDRAALDVAQALGIAAGGWCPKGRRAEDGVIPACYPLIETTSKDYRDRTRRNVRDANATLILTTGPLTGGTAYTRDCARRLGKPVLVVDLSQRPAARTVRDWLMANGVCVLNVAGPRGSGTSGIHAHARRFLRRVLADG
jgi:hypothetical protein